MRIIQCFSCPWDGGSYTAVLPTESKGLRGFAKSAGRPTHHCPWGFLLKGILKRQQVEREDWHVAAVSLYMTLVTSCLWGRCSDKVLKMKEELYKQAPSWERNASSVSCIKACSQLNSHCWQTVVIALSLRLFLCYILHRSMELAGQAPQKPLLYSALCR